MYVCVHVREREREREREKLRLLLCTTFTSYASTYHFKNQCSLHVMHDDQLTCIEDLLDQVHKDGTHRGH